MAESRVRVPKTLCGSSLLYQAGRKHVRVADGTVVEVETSDESYLRLSQGAKICRDKPTNERDIWYETVNVVTGPIHVEGAAVGDALEIEVLDVGIDRCWRIWDADRETHGALSRWRAEQGETSVMAEELRIDGDRIWISERLSVQKEPCIGTIATASIDPAHGSTFEPTFPNGGNMDLRQIQRGTKLRLPVLVPGAHLFVGDLHACMGRGEPCWVGFEAAGVAILRINVIKNHLLPWPRLYIGNTVIFTSTWLKEGCALEHDFATQDALHQAFIYLMSVHGLTPREAHSWLTAKGHALFGGPASRQALLSVEMPPPL